MMRLLVLGAAGGVGRAVVRLAAEHGHVVTAVARHDPPGVAADRWVSADVRDTAALAPLLDDADGVVWCVGVTKRSGGDVGRTALPPLVAAMTERGVRRFVGISGAGADLPDDRKGPGARLISALTHRLAPDVVGDKEGEYAVLAGSSLDWTQVRPPRLTSKPGLGRYSLSNRAPGIRARPVAREDVALALITLAAGRDWLQAAPFIGTADRTSAGQHAARG